jgi:DNA helicase II / ATP-dependent DNA helicase PcrA
VCALSIDIDKFSQEKEYLEDTVNWIDKEISIIKENDADLNGRVAELRKQSKGKYSEELETYEKLYAITHKNLLKYLDSKDQPYFGRIDFREYKRETEIFYIGKFGLGDSTSGDEKVIDWRSPISDLYYSGTYGDSYYKAPAGIINGELRLKRKFIIKEGRLIDAFDEGINEIILKAASEEGNALVDEYLRINLEESSSSKLKDVVATIQKEQNDIIRSEKNAALIVQGSAGSGKTTIALHRLAYLLYKYKEKLKGEDILVIAPNKLFLDYISEILPDLGVGNVKQKTFEQVAVDVLNIKGKIYTKDKKLSEIIESSDSEQTRLVLAASKIKGTNGFRIILDRYIRYMEKKDAEVQDIKVDEYVLFEVKEIKRLYIKDLAHLSLDARKDEIKRYFKLKLNDKISSILDKIDFSYEYMVSRVKKTMDDGKERREKLIELYNERDNKKKEISSKAKLAFEDYFIKWKKGNIDTLYYDLFTDENIFNEVTGMKLPEEISTYLRNGIKKQLEDGIIDSDDIGAMLYLRFKVQGVPEKFKFKHIVIDEAQDYSILQMLALKLMCESNSFTIVGDIGQGIYYYRGIQEWNKLIKNVFGGNANYVQLTQSYRSTVEIIEFANKILVKQKNSLKPAIPVLRHGMVPEVIKFKDDKYFAQKLDQVIEQIKALNKKRIAVIGKDFDECSSIKNILKKYSSVKWDLIKDTEKTMKSDYIIIPSYMTKGLEFDCTVIYNCSDKSYGDNEMDKKILYVILTRALHMEFIFYKDNISHLLL